MDVIVSSLYQVSLLEWAAALSTVWCIWLAGQNKVLTWPVGILAVGLYAILFHDAKLYADMILQGFFAATSLYGWLFWKKESSGYIEPITKSDRGYLIGSIVIGAGVAYLYSLILIAFTDSPAPMLDSLVLVFSVLGQLLLMRRNIENWPVWIFVNTISVPLYYSRGLYLTCFMYALFWIHAWYAWWKWNREME